MKQNKNIFYILLFLAMLGWGASWVNVKILGTYVNEFEMVFFRFGITALTMIPIIIYFKKSFKIDIQSLGLVLVTSLTLIAYNKYFLLGTKLGTASLGGAFVTTLIPIITFIFLVILRTKDITKKDIFALGIGAIGVMTILNVWTLSFDKIFITQNLYFVLAAIIWSVITILSSKSKKISPIIFTFYLYIITTILDVIFFVDISQIAYESFDMRFWINMASITLFASTFSNTVYFLGVEKLGANEVSSFIFLVPFAAIVLSAIFLDESISIFVIIGVILTLYAVKVLNNIKIFTDKT